MKTTYNAYQINSRLLLLAGVLLCSLGSCSKKVNPELINSGDTFTISGSAGVEPLKVDFLGTTSFGVQYKNTLLLTDPFVSNPPMKKTSFGKIGSDTLVVNRMYNRLDLENTKAVVVGHGHYDHLLDLPYLTGKLPGDAVIYGSQTTRSIVSACQPAQDIVAVNSFVGSTTAPGSWFYSADSTIRIMPFESDHLAHFMGIELYSGCYCDTLDAVPVKAKHWRCGMVISYLVDFMDDERIAWRLFIHSSSPRTDAGLVYKPLLVEKPIDITLSSVALHSEDYVAKVSRLYQPKAVFMTHWENFFRPQEPPYKSVSRSNINKSYAILRDSINAETALILPEPGSTFIFR